MQYKTVHSTQPVIADLSETISQALASGKKVLWLVSGGSTIPIAAAVAKSLGMHDVSNLTIMQVDERYGDVGHVDSNWQALITAGLDCTSAHRLPVLRGKDMKTTVAAYQAELAGMLQTADVTIGLFGIGPDGHTAGMLPHSSAATETKQLVVGYDSSDFRRITITAPAIAQLDRAVVYAVGPAKARTLQALGTDQPIADQPAQALKHAASLTVYTDYQGA